MSKMDINTWLEYPFSQLFIIEKGTRLTKAKMVDGSINYIGATAFNNGVTAKIGNTEHLHPAGTLTVCYNGSIGQTFYQEEPYWATDDVNVLYPKFKITPNIAKFLCSVIYKIGLKYAYIDKWTAEKMRNTMIKLPSNVDNEPDWEYMENYITNIKSKVNNNISLINNSFNSRELRTKIDTNNWKRFHLYDNSLFIIDSGTKLDRVKMTNNNPTVNFVGRANINNGVTDYIDEIEGLKPYEAGCLTISLGGEYLGSCFIQQKPFYTSQNVNVLIPKHEMNDYCKRFISTMIFREGRLRYKAFIDELNRHMKTDFSILLPVSNDNRPDWNFMEDYMRRIENRTKLYVSQMIYTMNTNV